MAAYVASAVGTASMRILLLSTGLKLGGAEQQVAALARQFVHLGHHVAVVSLTPDRDVELPTSVTVVQLGMRKTPLSMARALWKLRALVREWQPDVIHAHMVHANLLARMLAASGTTAPVICTAHSAREGGRLRMLAYRLTDRWASLTTHVSAQGRMAMVEAGAVSAARIRVVANGIDTQMYRPDAVLKQRGRTALGLQDDVRLLINVGRLVPEKAQIMLIDAFAQLNTGIDTRLLIVGEGPERDALERRIRHHRLEERVILAGARRDIATLLNAADLFVLSSDVEGMPLALAEALACGLPAVATDAAGVAELLNGCGEIVPRGNVSALANAMRQALTDPQTDTAAQAARRQHILSHFSLEAVAHQWVACYAQFIRPARMTTEEAA